MISLHKKSSPDTWNNSLIKSGVGAVAEGETLAQDLTHGRITPKKFAQKFAEIKKAGIFEAKTGLFSPSFFDAELKQEIAQVKRANLPLTLMIIDADGLKLINDSFGHLVGDKAISAIGKAIKNVIREEDIPSRWGGDEFVLLLPNTDIKGCQILATRIQKTLLNLKIRKNNRLVTVQVSIGMTELKKDDTADSFFDRADNAVYESKTKGGNLLTVL